MVQVITGENDIDLPPPAAPLTPTALKAVAALARQSIDARQLCSKLRVDEDKSMAELRKIAMHGSLDFDFTDGLNLPHLWTALRPVTFALTSWRK